MEIGFWANLGFQVANQIASFMDEIPTGQNRLGIKCPYLGNLLVAQLKTLGGTCHPFRM